MSDMKQTRFWQLAVILLVLCNVGLITVMWVQTRHPQDTNPAHGHGPRNFLISRLGFSADQVKQYDQLIQGHQQAMHHLHHSNEQLREALFADLAQPAPSDRVADSIAQLIAANQKEIEMATYHHFLQVRTLCTDAQKKEFDDVIGDVLRQMGPGGHDGPPPGGPGSPPPGRAGDGPPTDGPPPPGTDH